MDENDHPEYIGVKMGFLGTSSTLIPVDIATIDSGRGFVEVSQPKSVVKDGPAFDDAREVTPEYEEQVRAGTRERDAGALNVRKRVVTERERMEVPTRREVVTVDRVPVESEATETEIGDDEVRIPVTEEEVVVEKRPVAKEEVRIRKDVVEDTEVVEEDVRREEVDIDDHTTRREV